MAIESPINGVEGKKEDVSFAEQLQKKHAEKHDNHNPTVEDVEDEEDQLHPPPSSLAAPPEVADSTEQPPSLSEKAKGKQKAEDIPIGQEEKKPKAPSKPQVPDTNDEQSFPALGSAPKPRMGGPVPAAWSSQKPGGFASQINGTNGVKSGSGPGSRSSTPGNLTPTLNAQARTMQLPGKYRETVTLAPSQLLPREQLKKPVKDMLRDINKRSKATIEMKHAQGGAFAFESVGPSSEQVQQALKELAKQIGAKQTVKIPVPASVRPHIIGRGGTTVNNIIQKSGANVRVPKADETAVPIDEDDDLTIEVVIEGDPIAAGIARNEVQAIVRERTSTMNTRLRDIPAELYPFLAGPYNSALEPYMQGGDVQVKVPSYHSWSRQGPPALDENSQTPVFRPHQSSHIQLSGDRDAVQRAKAEIENQARTIQQQIAVRQLQLDRSRHQFIHGDSDAHHKFLEDTGCYVIIPPDHEDNDMVMLVGPPERLEEAEANAIEVAMQMQQQLIDVARIHGNAPQAQAHARALTDYLRRREAIRQLEEFYKSRISLPSAPDGHTSWELFSRDGPTAYRAKSDITNIIGAHPPSRLRQVDVHPFYHQHLRENLQDQLRQEHGVHLMLPEDEADDEPQVVIVYEGTPTSGAPYEVPRQRPSAADVARFEEALQQAQLIIEGLCADQQPIESRPVNVPQKLHDRVHRHVRQEQQDLPDGTLPIQFIAPSGPAREPMIRGPSDRLDPFAEMLRAFIEAEKQDELERGHITSFDFPKKHANFLIGRRGENINKLREEFDVDIKVHEGKVDIKGPPHKAEKAKARILAMGKKLDDEATHILKIHPQYHREMIGQGGNQVNRLQDRYNVRVQFPRTARNGHDDEGSVVNGSDAGGPRTARSNQAPDEVIIRGPKKGADAAREELDSLLKWTIENSQSATVSVAQSQLPSLIGTGGREMENIRTQTGAKIDVPGSRDMASPSGRVELKIKGTKKQVEEAKALLQQRAKVFDENVTRTIDVDKKYHRAIIGPQGSNLRRIVVAAGGSQDDREQMRAIKVPKPESDETAIRIEGKKDVVDKIVTEIQKIVSERENMGTDIVEVSPDKHRHLIGPRGETKRKLESELGVSIDIPNQSVQGSARSQIKLSGPAEKLLHAKEHIAGLFKEAAGETIQIPRSLHHAIAENGRFFARLRNDHRVIVDHGGQQPPAKSAAKLATSHNSTSGALPLITDDDPATSESHSWELIEGPTSTSDEPGDIPWILHGPSAESIAKARAQIEKALQRAKEPSCTGYLTLPDPSAHRRVIGTGGENINSIRRETGCKITVPRDRNRDGEAIEVIGSKEACEKARDRILEAVKGRY